jgi:hypothetical protein
METQIVIFLAFTSITLIFNAAVIWLIYKAFFGASVKVTETIQEFQSSETAMVWLEALQHASSNMVSLTESIKNRLAEVTPEIARAEAQFGFKLAELDLKMERSFSKVLQATRVVEQAVARPAHRFGATMSGVQGVLSFFASQQNDGDATSRRK